MPDRLRSEQGSAAYSAEWAKTMRMPDDDTQTLVDVLEAIEPRRRAFVRWLAEEVWALRQEVEWCEANHE